MTKGQRTDPQERLRRVCFCPFSMTADNYDRVTSSPFGLGCRLFHRYENIEHGSSGGETLITMQGLPRCANGSNVQALFPTVQRYKDNPSQWKPAGGQRLQFAVQTISYETATTNQRRKWTNSPELTHQSDGSFVCRRITHQFPLRQRCDCAHLRDPIRRHEIRNGSNDGICRIWSLRSTDSNQRPRLMLGTSRCTTTLHNIDLMATNYGSYRRQTEITICASSPTSTSGRHGSAFERLGARSNSIQCDILPEEAPDQEIIE